MWLILRKAIEDDIERKNLRKQIAQAEAKAADN